jgi:hypothetical protein
LEIYQSIQNLGGVSIDFQDEEDMTTVVDDYVKSMQGRSRQKFFSSTASKIEIFAFFFFASVVELHHD